MTAYSALTPNQQQAIASKFCDQTFGTDPRGYDYQLLRPGEWRRTPLAPRQRQARKLLMVQSTRASILGDAIIMEAVVTDLARQLNQMNQAGRPGDVPGGMQGHAASLSQIQTKGE